MMTDWAIPQQAKLKYTQLFNLHDRNRTGFLSGVQCRDILMQSGLPRNILAEIWNLSDIDGDGQLTREEFILAMHLTNQVRSGQALPSQLTPDLIPPSYRRQRSISSTSVQSATSASSSIGSGAGAKSAPNDDQVSHKSTESASILNSNSFEDKRRENFEKGRAELERRRLRIIEQQSSILSEQLARCKKQVAEAKSKIDNMRSERDTKAGLVTSLEAQLKTVRDRKAFLDHEEVQLIAIAKDLNLVNSGNSVELDQQATQARQESIIRMKEKLATLTKERDETIKKSLEAKARVEALQDELKSVGEEADKAYRNYNEHISKAKCLKEQIVQEGKSRLVDLDSAWDADRTNFSSSLNQQSNPITKPAESTNSPATSTVAEDPWAPTIKQISADPFAPESNNNISSVSNNFDPLSPNISPKINDQSSPFTGKASIGFNDGFVSSVTEPVQKKMYKAIYAFDARNVDELTINPGDIIIGSDVVCEPGWLSGTIGTRTGLFPEAYVEPMTDDIGDFDGETTATLELATNVCSQQNSASMEPIYRDASQQQATSSMLPSVVKYRVLYAFEARNIDELNINPGDIITGVEGQHEPGWLMGELNGQRGLFPEAYVEKLAEAKVEKANVVTEQMGTLRRGGSSGSLRSKKSRSKKAEVATVIANYRALGQEQLNLEKGQLVLIRRKIDSGWWEGELQIKDTQQPASIIENPITPNPQSANTSELYHLTSELVDSEWDYVNDLRLCQSAYIFPLSNSFDISHIFFNWNQIIQVHESSLTKLSECSKLNRCVKFDYCSVFETFQNLLNSITSLYVGFCSRQDESSRQLEAKIASDIRFKQLVNESQRRLRKLIEQQVEKPVQVTVDQLSAEQARALRNSNLPLTSFLIKPMQRITKYGLLFDRMLHVANVNPNYNHLQAQLNRLKQSAQALCTQVNEACRLKEDDQDNDKRLRWCQSHIKQPGSTSPTHSPSLRSSFNYSSMSSVELRVLSSMSGAIPTQDVSSLPVEPIQFNSNTRCLGRRWLIKAGSLSKLRSGRELVVFLFNDLLLLTHVKGGTLLRVDDVFRSNRAQQSYYKFYRPPILLEDIQLEEFDNEQLFQSPSCPSINSSSSSGAPTKEQEALMISFLDRHSGCIHNLIALSAKERDDWTKKLSERVLEAQTARNSLDSQRALVEVRRLSVSDCRARLFVTVLELTRITSTRSAHRPQSLSDLSSSWRRRLDSSNQIDSIQNLCIRMQMRLYKKTQTNSIDEKREVVALSEQFQTNPITINESRRQPVMVDMNESMSNLDVQRDKYTFSKDSTQFLIAHNPMFPGQGHEYLDVELVDYSRFHEIRLVGRKRMRLDQLLGRNTNIPIDSRELVRKTSNQSSRSIQSVEPNRPIDMVFKLKSVCANSVGDVGANAASSVPERPISQADQQRFNLKLRFHLQLFGDTPNFI